MARPTDMPRMPDSASGVSKTRCAPCLACSPSVIRKTPPSRPQSSPKMTALGFSASASSRARLSACCMDITVPAEAGAVFSPLALVLAAVPLSRIELDMFGLLAPVGGLGLQGRGGFLEDQVKHFGSGARAEGLDADADLLLLGLGGGQCVGEERLVRNPVRQQPLLEPLQRVLAGAVALLVEGAVAAGVIGGGVRTAAVGHGFDQHRAVTGAGVREGAAGRPDDGDDVVAVDLQRRHAVAGRAGGDGAASHLAFGGNRDGPAVVLHEEDHGRLHHGGEVQCLVDVALRGRSVAEVGQRDAVFLLQGLAVGPADGVQHGSGDDGLDRGKPGLQRVVEAAVPGGLVGGHIAHHVHAHGPGDAHLAVGGEDEVAGGVDGVAAAHLGRLLAEFRGVAGNDALPLPGDRGGVQVPHRDHQRIQLAQLGGSKRAGVVAGNREGECVHACDPSHGPAVRQSVQQTLTTLPKAARPGSVVVGNLFMPGHPTSSQLLSFSGFKTTTSASQLGLRALIRAPIQQATAKLRARRTRPKMVSPGNPFIRSGSSVPARSARRRRINWDTRAEPHTTRQVEPTSWNRAGRIRSGNSSSSTAARKPNATEMATAMTGTRAPFSRDRSLGASPRSDSEYAIREAPYRFAFRAESRATTATSVIAAPAPGMRARSRTPAKGDFSAADVEGSTAAMTNTEPM